MFKDVQRKLKELSHLRWNSLKSWSISLQKFHLWTYFNIFTGWKALKDGNYFNVFNIISTDLFQHYFNSIISTNMSFKIFQHIYFNLFQRYFNIYFNVFTGWKPLKDEIYFNIISTYLIRRVHWWGCNRNWTAADSRPHLRASGGRASSLWPLRVLSVGRPPYLAASWRLVPSLILFPVHY